MTKVTITGTGMPPVEAGRAGPGVLVQHGDVALQFDAGRATALRLAEAGLMPAQLDAVFITHHHSDHVTGIVDLFFTAWLNRPTSVLLEFVAPTGPSTRFLERMLYPYEDDLAVRIAHTNRDYPTPTIKPFTASPTSQEVWSSGDVRVLACAVHHHPVEPAVAYRIETPDGVVVISGDTRVCDEVEDLARGCDVLVHEAFRVDAFVKHTGDEGARVIGDYHADTVALGTMADRADPGVLMITHMAPPPRSAEDRQAFIDEIRHGGFSGDVRICEDLDHVEFSGTP